MALMQLRVLQKKSCDVLSDQFLMVDKSGYFSFHPVLHNWCNIGRTYIEHLLLIRKSGLCGRSGFPLSLSGSLPYIWHNVTINKNVLSASLSKNFLHSFLPSFVKHSSEMSLTQHAEDFNLLILCYIKRI